MKIKFKSFAYLPEESKKIRTDVFVFEQGFIDEFDENDDKSIHVLMYDGEAAIGTCRIVYSDEHKSIAIGRFAVSDILPPLKEVGASCSRSLVAPA